MINRWVIFAASTLTGAGLGWWGAAKDGLGPGVILGGFAWLLLDSLYVARLLKWLRTEQSNETPAVMAAALPRLPGVWGEFADRTRRLLKNRDQQ
jgi:two-component system, OmpR family, phosphate regulon sensor histidine kinase PhoR